MASAYIYPGNRNEFFTEYGGLPDRSLSLSNIFLIFLIIIVIIIVIFLILYLLARTKIVYTDHKGFYNLDTLIDVNNGNVECCVPVGSNATSEEYIYDVVNNITYSRQVPVDIDVVCNTFPDPASCVSQNTDGSGKIIPRVTFAAQPYYTWENGLFVGCGATSPCI